MTNTIRKAVIPVAGLGTRFLPATKAMPKEMLTIVDRPALDYVVAEALAAGIEHIVFVTGRNKSVIEDHFDMAYELQDTLEKRGNKQAALDILAASQLPAGACSFTRQQEPLGLGHAVGCARDIVGNEPFAVMLPDMVMKSSTPCLKSMVDLHATSGGNVLAVEECPEGLAHQYGVVAVGDEVGDGFEITGMVEKPAKGTEPSNLFLNGRYILQPDIFELIATQERGAGSEIQLTDAMLRLLENQKFFGFHFRGDTYDTGSIGGFVAANIAFGVEHAEAKDAVADEIARLG
ncbi:MAG: UTP--glucose-1-phosphate uridylyltransferase [Pseudomonadota bacterium]